MLQTMSQPTSSEVTGGSRATAYQAALAHSRRVRRLRILLPIAAAVISAIFIAVSFVRAYLPEKLTIQSARIEDGKIVMESPAMAGRNEKGVSYSLTATRALQDLQNQNHLTLENVKAAMPLNATVIARVAAESGVYDRSTDRMNLTAPFQVDLSNGITANFQSASLDVQQGLMDTQDTVHIKTQEASIVAQSMKISDKGKTISFAGQVQVNLAANAIHNEGNQSSAP
ncbi:LPS export ABC transporter periplasmic protein LptC [Rhizobium oryzicola]|uniref:LPS export ABC transporter periplasmic protein LptC n=1 Tax=Rhizobium oryzicola TaxID=1232668 RepID=A0ABT8SQR3_9HYPH|nr:LPS export ABC transporter periplasmic protein LptC [Rhizobium oryzicola]MDO1580795.1 LPS export ABC transporter periplasmic protein LptC [Rhizobium oryzicola]